MSSTRVAEMTKILENIHRAVNIGLVNELKMVAHKMDIDIYEVIEAASTNHLDLHHIILDQALEVIVFQLTLLFDLESKRNWNEYSIY